MYNTPLNIICYINVLQNNNNSVLEEFVVSPDKSLRYGFMFNGCYKSVVITNGDIGNKTWCAHR